MAALPPSLVYEGFWIDHSLGSVFGATLTLSTSRANIVLVILTLIIAFAGSHLWDLIAFLNFLSKSTDLRRDGIHHQLQLLLRNASSPSTYAWECLKLLFSWRFIVKRRYLRLVYTTILAIICSVGFIAAGILSSKVLSSGSISVLVRPLNCGYYPDNPSPEASLEISDYHAKAIAASWTYAKKCYQVDTGNDPACNIYTQPAIKFTSSYDSCPFTGTCILKNNTALTMDTGLLDSDAVFGVNAKAEDTIRFRRRNTCGVIDTGRHLAKIPHSEVGTTQAPFIPDQMDWTWNFGSSLGYIGNITFAQSVIHANTTSNFEMSAAGNFPPPLGSVDPPDPRGWSRIPPFDRNDTDLVLLLVQSNGITYGAPTDDPLFSAHDEVASLVDWLSDQPVFKPDSPGNVLGCIEEYQFCTPKGDCTSLGPSRQALEDARQLPINEMQNATVRRFEDQISAFYFVNSIMIAGMTAPPSLHIVDSLSRNTVNVVPNDQWEIETKAMFSLTLARMQKGFADIATGPLGTANDQHYEKYFAAPTDPAGVTLCSNQKMKAPNGFSNINVFGLAFIVGLCGLIILINLVASPAMKVIARHNKPMSVGMRHWIADGMLQVQRKAFQRSGYGNWCNIEHDVPVTRPLGEFPGLAVDESDENARRTKNQILTTMLAVGSSDGGGDSSSASSTHVERSDIDGHGEEQASVAQGRQIDRRDSNGYDEEEELSVSHSAQANRAEGDEHLDHVHAIRASTA